MRDDEPDGEGRKPIGALIGLAVIAILVVVGLWLSNRLHSSANMQDCLAAGRTNCAPVETPAAR